MGKAVVCAIAFVYAACSCQAFQTPAFRPVSLTSPTTSGDPLFFFGTDQEQETKPKQFDEFNPNPSTLLCNQSEDVQRAGAIAIVAGLSLGTYAAIQALHGVTDLLPSSAFLFARNKLVGVPLGAVFALVGISHFVYLKEFAKIVPPNGSWGGLWSVPSPGNEALKLSPEDYHVAWTGVAEFLLGAGLLVGGWTDNDLLVRSSAAFLFALTVAVTPANMYMFTHNVPLEIAPPMPYPAGHIARGVLQCGLLACYFTVAFV